MEDCRKYPDFADTLRRILFFAGVSQAGLAERLEVSRQFVGMFCCGTVLPGDYIGVNYTTPPLYEETDFSPTLTLLRDDGVSVSLELPPFRVKVTPAARETDPNPETPAERQASASKRENLFQRAMYALINARGLHLWLTGLSAAAAVFIVIRLLRAPGKANSGKDASKAKQAKDAADKTNV